MIGKGQNHTMSKVSELLSVEPLSTCPTAVCAEHIAHSITLAKIWPHFKTSFT